MKYPVYLMLAALLGALPACNDRHPGDPTVSGVSADAAIAPKDTADNSGGFAEEREQYRYRISRRLAELEGEIEEARKRRQFEKDQLRSREYDARIAERETSRKTFQERLDGLERQTESGWQNFKTELDDLFNGDKASDSLRTTR